VHTSIAAQINGMLQRRGLSDIGRTEQDIVFGEATSKVGRCKSTP